MTQEQDPIFYNSIDELKDQGYSPVRAWSVLQFFALRGKTSIMCRDNIEPLVGLPYLLRSPQENRYYLKEYHNYPLDVLYFYRRTDTFSGQDVAVENLRRYVADGNITLLFDKELVERTQSMLARIWKNQRSDEGTLPYRDYLTLLKLNLDYEDYKEYSKNLVGFKTVCSQYETQIRATWSNIPSAKK